MLTDSSTVALRGNKHPKATLNFEGFGAKQDVYVESLSDRTALDLEEHDILTSLGMHQRVYVQPSKNKTALITYHDIGTNHTSFLGFFNLPEMRVICKHFTVYHVCAPGHHENAPTEVLDEQTNSNQSDSLLMQPMASTGSESKLNAQSQANANNAGYPSLDQLAHMLTSIIGHFGIKSFIGMGMGAGSSVLARYALLYPNNVLGLFLLNPNNYTESYYQWMRLRYWDIPYLQQGVFTDNLLDHLYNHWFGEGLAENEDLMRFYEQLARSLNTRNLAGYMQAYVDRTALNLVRPTLPMNTSSALSDQPTVIRADVCLVTGDRAQSHARAMAEMNGQMDPKCTQFIAVPDCTAMLMEENPDKLAMDFLHFLRSIGLLINVRPEKLHEEALFLCTNGMEYSVDIPPADLHVNREF